MAKKVSFDAQFPLNESKFAVDFHEAIDPHVADKLEALLPPK